MDAVALRNGEVPQKIVAKAKGEYDWMDYVDDISTKEGKTGISLQDVDTMIVAEWEQHKVFTVQGTYDSKTVGNQLNPLDHYDRVEPEGSTYEAWKPIGTNELTAMVENQVYWFLSWKEGMPFLEEVSQGNRIVAKPDHHMIAAMEKVGQGWLVAGLTGWKFCNNLYVEFDEDLCLSMAFAVSTGKDSNVNVTWAILLDSEENAQVMKQAIDDQIASREPLSSSIGGSAISDIDIDGQFVVMQATTSTEGAVYFLGESGL